MNDVPLNERPGSGLTRRDLLGRSAALGAAISVPSLFGAAAADASTAAAKPKRGGHLRVGMNDGGAGDTLAPWNIPIYSAAARAEQVYERLYKYDAHAVPRPRLGESLTSNRKATIWRLTLRKGVTFHSGQTMTADDVLYSLRYVANPKNKAESLTRLEPIDFNATRKVSPTEIEFHLKSPIGDFAGLLAEKAVWIVPAGMTNFNKPNGTGPFKFLNWQPGVRANFTRNDNYWGIALGGGPWVDSVEILDITDDTARVNALIGNQVDEIAFMPFVQAKAHASDNTIQIIRAAQPQTNPFYVQMDRKPFNDNNVRLALKYAVDRNAMVRQVELGYGSIGNDLFGKGFPSYNNHLPQREYDPERSKSLLKKAGYDSAFPFTLPTSDALPGMLESATAFKEQAKAAGIDVTLEKLDAGSYFSNNKYLKVSSYQTNWGQSFESQVQDGMLKTSPYNETHWYDAKWSAAFRKAQEIPNTAKRNAAYQELQVPLWKTNGYVVFAFYNTVDAASAKVRGIVPNISSGYSNLGAFDFKNHWFA